MEYATVSLTEEPSQIKISPALQWLIRKRVTLTIATFTALIVYNIVIAQTDPRNPFQIGKWRIDLAVSLIVLGLVIRSWAAGTLHKNESVTDVGPYALMRNPLYVGSFMMMFAFAYLMRDWMSALFIAGPMVIVYSFQVYGEERGLLARHQDVFRDYCHRVGRFIPKRFTREVLDGFSWAQWRKNREYEAIIATFIGLIAISVLSYYR